MSNIIQSASKIVFVMIALTLCITIITEVVLNRITIDAKDFLVLAGMAFTFYFAQKGDQTMPMAGK